MAKKLLNPMEDPPTASSSDDEEMQNSPGEEDDSSSEHEESKDPIKTAAKPSSDSESKSETETDSDSETERPPSPRSGKSITAAAKPATKRPNEGPSKDTKTKRAKITSIGDDEIKTGEDSKKPAFQRLWSEQDEITLLQGMINFNSDTGKSPYESSNKFYEIIKESISFEFSKNQFMDKIRSLKRKYITKEKTGGVFSKSHDKKCFELSKIIWGPEGLITLESANGAASKKSPKSKNIVVEDDKKVLITREPDWFDNSFIVKSIASFGVDECYVKQKWSLVPVETKKKIEEKLKVLQAKETEVVLEKIEFVHKVTSMINEVSKN